MVQLSDSAAIEAPKNPVGPNFNYTMKYTAAAKAVRYKWKGNWYTPHPNRQLRRMQDRLKNGCKPRPLAYK